MVGLGCFVCEMGAVLSFVLFACLLGESWACECHDGLGILGGRDGAGFNIAPVC